MHRQVPEDDNVQNRRGPLDGRPAGGLHHFHVETAQHRRSDAKRRHEIVTKPKRLSSEELAEEPPNVGVLTDDLVGVVGKVGSENFGEAGRMKDEHKRNGKVLERAANGAKCLLKISFCHICMLLLQKTIAPIFTV